MICKQYDRVIYSVFSFGKVSDLDAYRIEYGGIDARCCPDKTRYKSRRGL